jgi:hypothetical protein
MASVTITLTSVCSGNNHLTFTLTGAASKTVRTDLNDVTTALTDDDLEAVIKGLVKLGKIGRTNAQLRTLFQAGVVVTV